MPVKNGGEYVKECVNSILAQSFADFELLVLDNNSSDGTKEWLRSLADQRIRIFPAERSLSIEENWGRIQSVPKSEFMTLIGHDDKLNIDYLETMNALIDQYPEASLYQTHFFYMNAQGKKIRDCKSMAAVESAEEFLQNFLLHKIDVMGTGFLMRSSDYDGTGGIPAYPNLLFADFELWIRLTQKNFKATSERNCFAFRLHQSTTNRSDDVRFHLAFERFIFFLEKLKNEKQSFRDVISHHAAGFISFYCRSLSHRLLRTPKSKRGNLTVRSFVRKCKEYARMLEIDESFRPEQIFSVKLAMALDASAVGRALFLGFKKIYPKPIMK